jgi:hypothetical protein
MTTDHRTVVYRYGCPSWADFDEPAIEQLFLANRLWNALVEMERDHDAKRDAIYGEQPEVGVAQVALDDATRCVEEIATEMKAHRQRDRSTTPRSEDKAALMAARQARKAAKEDLKLAKTAAKPIVQVRLSELAGEHKQRIVEIRREFAATGLYWGTYNDVLQRRFPAAVKQVIERRKRGLPAELHFRRFDGTGTLTTQIQWQRGKPEPTQRLLASDDAHPWRNVYHLTLASRLRIDDASLITASTGVGPSTGDRRYGTLRLRVSGEHTLTLPVVLHRPIPNDAVLKEIKVTRRRLAGHFRVTVAVCCQVPVPEPKTEGEAVDVDFRWSSETGVGVRVARISTATGHLPPPPAEVAPLLADNDTIYELWAPQEWRDLLARVDAIRADRDVLLDNLRPSVVEALGDRQLAETVGFAPSAAKLMGFGKYRRLVRVWPDDPLKQQLETWRSRDRFLWEWEANERDQIVARRNDVYRKVAAWLATSARIIAIHDVPISRLRQAPVLGDEDTYMARGARRNIQFAAPDVLRQAIENASAARGVTCMTYTHEESNASAAAL